MNHKDHKLVDAPGMECIVCGGYFCMEMVQRTKPCQQCVQSHYRCSVSRAKDREEMTKAMIEMEKMGLAIKEHRCHACESRIHTKDETCLGEEKSKDWLDVLAGLKTKA